VPFEDCDKFGAGSVVEATATSGAGVLATFFALVERAWAHLDRDLHLAAKLGIDAQSFRNQLAEHVGADPGVAVQ